MQKKYHVTLSFAGEDRKHAKRLADLLRSGGYSVFYDEYEATELWGKDLYDYLLSVYRDQSEYCVMFLSEHYAQKLWTNHERQSAQERALKESKEYILPVRLDDTEVPGILSTVGCFDLRSTPIEEIYEALVEKLSDTTSPTTPEGSVVSAAQNDLGEFVLLRPEDGESYFIPVQNARWDSTEIFLELLPESTEQTAFLSSVRKNVKDQFAQVNKFALALQDNASWVSPKEIAQTMSGPQTFWKIVLEENDSGQGYSALSEVTFNNISSDDIAEMRAKRILLNEKSFQNQTGLAGLTTNDTMLESLVSSGVSLRHNNIIQVSESPIPNLYRSFGREPERFLKFARLTSALYLKLSNTVEDILLLNLELLGSKKLRVRFKGRRPQRYTNIEASTLDVNGICPLSY